LSGSNSRSDPDFNDHGSDSDTFLVIWRKLGLHLQLEHTASVGRGDVTLPIDVILLNELWIIGAFGMEGRRFSTVLDMIESGKLEPGKLGYRTVSLEKVTGVLESLHHYGTAGITVINQY
jgi:D-arabinose 1-dehydrogenase-like Zn-dependent alcohol dehydrogenase